METPAYHADSTTVLKMDRVPTALVGVGLSKKLVRLSNFTLLGNAGLNLLPPSVTDSYAVSPGFAYELGLRIKFEQNPDSHIRTQLRYDYESQNTSILNIQRGAFELRVFYYFNKIQF